MKEEIRKMIYDEIENPWEFVVLASEEYKNEFRKTAKFGMPPKIDDILKKVILKQKGIEIEEEEPRVPENEETVEKEEQQEEKNRPALTAV